MASTLGLLVLTFSLQTGAGAEGSNRPSALFFGDSLIGGTGARPHSPVEPLTTAHLLGWDPVIDAFGGTGYTTGGKHGRRYLERLRRDGFLSRPYDVIVLEGGTNDAWFGSLSTLHDAAVQTIGYVQQRQPQARIILVGGYAPSGIDLERYAQMDQTLAGVADRLGLQYVSQLHFSSPGQAGLLSRDHYHPSAAGYRVMGRELARAIRAR